MKPSAIETYRQYEDEVAVMQNDDSMSLLLKLAEHAIREVDSSAVELLAKAGFVRRVEGAIELSDKGRYFLSLLDVEAKPVTQVFQDEIDKLKKIEGYLNNTLPPDTRDTFELEMFENDVLLKEVSLMRDIEIRLRDNAALIFGNLPRVHHVSKTRKLWPSFAKLLKPLNAFKQKTEKYDEVHA